MTENIKELLLKIQEHKLFFDYDFRLIGGTALSYHLNHRLSEDLDFCFKGKFYTPGVIYPLYDIMH